MDVRYLSDTELAASAAQIEAERERRSAQAAKEPSGEAQRAARDLAEQISEDLDISGLPLMEAGGAFPVIEIPEQMVEHGGVAIAALVIRPSNDC